MNIASIKVCDVANGPGLRTSVFVSGCRRHCKGCFNEVAWDFEYGEEFTENTLYCILDTLKQPNIDGLTLLGGEPFEPENTHICALLAREAIVHGKTVWTYSGFTFEELFEKSDHLTPYYDILNFENPSSELASGFLLKYTDVLVDGPFIESQKDISLKFRGSKNQRIIDVPKSLKEGKVILLEEYM